MNTWRCTISLLVLVTVVAMGGCDLDRKTPVRLQDDPALSVPDAVRTLEVVPANGSHGDSFFVETDEQGWCRGIVEIILIIAAAWLAIALVACLLLLWIVRSPQE